MNIKNNSETQIEYEISKFTKVRNKTSNKSKKLGYIKLAVFFGNFFIFYLTYKNFNASYAIITFLLLFILFLLLTNQHNKVIKYLYKIDKWIEIKRQFIEKINFNWEKMIPIYFEPESTHPYDRDLNINGQVSLHRYINFSYLYNGAKCLSSNLLNPVLDKATITKKQSIIKELASNKKLREKLIFYSLINSEKKIPNSESAKFNKEILSSKNARKTFILLSVISLITVSLFAFTYFFSLPNIWAISLLIYAAIFFFNFNTISDIETKMDYLNIYAGKFYNVFSFIEKFPLSNNSALSNFLNPFKQKEKPSNLLKELDKIDFINSFVQNPILGFFINLLFPLSFFVAYRLDVSAKRIEQIIPECIDILYQLEAYNSFAMLDILNNDYIFPNLNDEEYKFEFNEAGHALIPSKNNILNNYCIEGKSRVDLLTGSNMSGKSTFLKTIGTNLVLAYCGSAVKASYFNTSVFRLYTCINISDSVTDGISYFYAEVKRLKLIKDEIEIEGSPVFFLIDEIFKGTNNIERLIGSNNYVNYLSKQKCLGLITSHDIELTKLAEENNVIKNFHFREHIEKDELGFDYKLKDGPCPTTNALTIMKMGGLPS